MKIDLLTLYYSNYSQLAALVLPNWEEYCQRHDYGLRTHVGTYVYADYIPIGFHKIKLLYDHLFLNAAYPEAVLMLDLDIMITNTSVRLETPLAKHPDASYLVCNDVNGWNNGSFIVRRNENTKQILEYVMDQSTRKSNEQDALKFDWQQLPFAQHIKILPHPSINSLDYNLYPEFAHHAATNPGQWKPGHFLLHLPGMSLERRLGIFQSEKIQSAIIR